MTSVIADRGDIDTDLVQAANGLQAVDQAIANLYRKFGDDTPDREDYLALEDERDEHIATLVTVRAESMTGIEAKSVCVRLRTLIECSQHQQVAVSLADDLIKLGPRSIAEPLLAAADGEIVAAGEKFERMLGEYLDARFIWAPLAREASAKTNAKFEGAAKWKGPTKDDPKWAFHSHALRENGCEEASKRLCEIATAMDELADDIRDGRTESIGGLRAKMLVAIWTSLPIRASHDGEWSFEDGYSYGAVFEAAIAVTGLSGMFESVDSRLMADRSEAA
jgi:hypothetical protein